MSETYPDERKLVTIWDYAKTYNITRHTVYRLLKEGKITRFLGPDGEPLLDESTPPEGVRKYIERPAYEEQKVAEKTSS